MISSMPVVQAFIAVMGFVRVLAAPAKSPARRALASLEISTQRGASAIVCEHTAGHDMILHEAGVVIVITFTRVRRARVRS